MYRETTRCLFGLGLCLVLLLSVGCRDRERSNALAATLQLAINSPKSIDPNLVSESEGGQVVENTFEGLYVPGPRGDEVRPGVASGHEVSEDGLVWRFHLREEARWSDGAPVVAQDFVYSWLRVLDPSTAAEYASIMKPIAGAEAFTRCQSDAQALGGDAAELCARRRDDVGVRAISEHELEVRLITPDPLFDRLTAFFAFLPVPQHVLERSVDGAKLRERSRWVTPEHWVSNGPYRLVEDQDRVQIVLEKNPHYWDRDAVQIERVVYRIMVDFKARYAAYAVGQLDILEDSIPGGELRKRWTTGSPQLQIHPRLSTYMILFNTRQVPFSNVDVRRAFNLAIDKSSLVKFTTGGGEVPASTFVPAMLARLTDYPGVEGIGYDPAAARERLALAGYPGGKDPKTGEALEVSYGYNTNENHKKIAESVAKMLERNLGVKVRLFNQEWKTYLDRLKRREFELGRYGWIADYVDPMTFLDPFESDSAQNYSGWEDLLFDRLIKKARLEKNPKARYKLLRQAEERFMEALPAIPVYFYSQKLLIKPRVEGVEPHLLGIHLVKYMRLRPQP